MITLILIAALLGQGQNKPDLSKEITIRKYQTVIDNNVFVPKEYRKPIVLVGSTRKTSPAVDVSASPYLLVIGIALDTQQSQMMIKNIKNNEVQRIKIGESVNGALLESLNINSATLRYKEQQRIVGIGQTINFDETFLTEGVQQIYKPKAVEQTNQNNTQNDIKQSLLERLKQRRQQQVK
ncbi:hypothetical protein JD969_17695 [Planctomycetota bacterium]|nr:hypothetical protein JD969_17695 [Planctomycetota bacterium]